MQRSRGWWEVIRRLESITVKGNFGILTLDSSSGAIAAVLGARYTSGSAVSTFAPWLFPCIAPHDLYNGIGSPLWAVLIYKSFTQTKYANSSLGFVSLQFTETTSVVRKTLLFFSQASIAMRFSTLLLALIPAATLAAPVPAPGMRVVAKIVQNGPNLTDCITNYRLLWRS